MIDTTYAFRPLKGILYDNTRSSMLVTFVYSWSVGRPYAGLPRLLAGFSWMPRRLLGSPRHVASFARTRLRIYCTLAIVSCEKDARLV